MNVLHPCWAKPKDQAVWRRRYVRSLGDIMCRYIINDIHPKAQEHYLVIPKRHIRDIWFLRDQDRELLHKMKTKAIKTMKKEAKDCTMGFHTPYLTGVNHLHMHVLAGQRGGFKVSSHLGEIYRIKFSHNGICYFTHHKRPSSFFL